MHLRQGNLAASPSPGRAIFCPSCYFRMRHKSDKRFLGKANLFIVVYYSVNRQSSIVDCYGDPFMFADMRNKKASQSPAGTSTAVEDYLERILELINSKGYARVIDIAAALKISQASVTNMVQRLDAEGLLKYEKYRGLILTAAIARNVEGLMWCSMPSTS